jgi:hypothetical protein
VWTQPGLGELTASCSLNGSYHSAFLQFTPAISAFNSRLPYFATFPFDVAVSSNSATGWIEIDDQTSLAAAHIEAAATGCLLRVVTEFVGT